MQKLVLDRVEGMEIDISTMPIRNLHALEYLPQGMYLLGRSVREQEIEVWKNTGGHLLFDAFPASSFALMNYFAWFSVSLMSYLRLARVLVLMQSNSWSTADIRKPKNRELARAEANAYIQRVAPPVYAWRNKVAAHPALVDPFPSDSLGTLEMSIMAPVSYDPPYYHAAAFLWGTGGEQAQLPKWSLTKTFEDLAPRLWPPFTLEPIPINPSGG